MMPVPQYDVLAVFSANADMQKALEKLHKEGFSTEEISQPDPAVALGGEIREHGPNSTRSSFFLRTTRTKVNLLLVGVCSAGSAIILALLGIPVHIWIHSIPELSSAGVGGSVGLLGGGTFGFLAQRRIRGNIGQKSVSNPALVKSSDQGTQCVVAIHLNDGQNIVRKSQARAILLNNGGRIVRLPSV